MNIDKAKTKIILKETIETIVFVIVMVIIIKFFIGEIRWIPSASMHPTLLEGDKLFIERFSRFYSVPKRGDIMVFYPPATELKYDFFSIFKRLTGFGCKDDAYIKRVIGLPGDTYEVKELEDGEYEVLINDKPLKEDYIQSSLDYNPCTDFMYCGPSIIPEGEYFVLGDNRGNSKDSRYLGLIPKDRFVGKAKVIIWPVSRVRYFKHVTY